MACWDSVSIDSNECLMPVKGHCMPAFTSPYFRETPRIKCVLAAPSEAPELLATHQHATEVILLEEQAS